MALVVLGMFAAELGYCFIGTGLRPSAQSSGRLRHATMPYLDFGESSAQRIDHLSEEINRLRKEMAQHRRIHAEFEASVQKLEERVRALEDSDEMSGVPSALQDMWTSVKELDRQVDAVGRELDVEARRLDAARDVSLVDGGGTPPKASYSISSEDTNLRARRMGFAIDSVEQESIASLTKEWAQDEAFRLGGDHEILPLESAGGAQMRSSTLLDHSSTHSVEAANSMTVGLKTDENDIKDDIEQLVMVQEDAAKEAEVATLDSGVMESTGTVHTASASKKGMYREASNAVVSVEKDPSPEDRMKEPHAVSCTNGVRLDESRTGLAESRKLKAIKAPAATTDQNMKTGALLSLVTLLKGKANINGGNARSHIEVAPTTTLVQDADNGPSATIRASVPHEITSDYLLSLDRSTQSHLGSVESHVDYDFTSSISTLSASKQSPSDYLSTLKDKTFVLTPRSYAGADFLELKSEAGSPSPSNNADLIDLSTIGFSRAVSRYRTHVVHKRKREKVRREAKESSSKGLPFGSSDFFAALSSRSPKDRDRAAMITILVHRARYYMTRKQIIPMMPTAPLRSDSVLTQAGNSSTPIVLQRRTRRMRPKEDR